MRNSLKHLLSLLLVLVMMLSCITMVSANEAAVAVNTATGTQYDNLTDALFDAAEGQTVQLTQDVQDTMTTVFDGVTLDLNGYALTTKYMSCYGDLIDGSESNSGLLNVADSRFMLREQNSQLTVKTGDGYRFVEVTGFNTAMVNATKYAFQPLLEADALELLAQGSAVTGVTVQVHVSWMQANGERTQDFTYNDSHLAGYLESYNATTGKFGKMFALTLTGADDFDQLTFTAQVVSDTGVYFAPTPSQGETEDGKSDVTTDENGQLVGDLTLENENASAFVSTGTQLEDGTTTLVLTTDELTETGSDVALNTGESMVSLDVHVEGISKDNTVPVIITLDQLAPEALNQGNITLYHVENSETVAMTRVYSMDELDAHNEYYYDIPTGTVTVALASFSEVAVVANVENPWGGKTDTSWYNTTGTVFTIYNADQLAGFGALVDGGNTFDGKTIKLGFDIDLYGTYEDAEEGETRYSFNPIGYGYETSGGQVFKGTFDGQGHTIYNLYQNGWALGYSYGTQGGGLFASVVDAEFYNVNLDHANVVMECVDMGTLVGYAYGTCHFENIIVSGSTVQNYNRYTGGVVGEVNGDHTFINVDVDADTILSALWGTFDPSVGGIIGGKYGDATVYMENCDVACELDVYNDVTSAYRWYSYRRCGMLIGYTEESKTIDGRTEATASFLTTKNCTVQYGDWANYHYCQFSNERYPFVRVEAGLSNSAYSNPRYGHPKGNDNQTLIDETNHNTSVAHKDGETCTMLATFHQLYGGGQGCYGGNDHVGKGVTVLDGIESATKFDKVVEDGFVVYKDQTYTLGELFAAVQLDPEKNLGIQALSLNAFVSPTTVEGSAAGTFTRATNWEDSTLTFSGVGPALITIDDYYYCDPTVLKVYVAPDYTLTVQSQYSGSAEADQYALYLNTDEAVTLGDYRFTLGLEDLTYNAFDGQSIGEGQDSVIVSWQAPQEAITVDQHHIYLGSFQVPANTNVTESVLSNVQIGAIFEDTNVPGKVTVNSGYFHDHTDGTWTAWTSTTSLPTASGKYYLTADVTLSNQASFDYKDITLCLNGHNVTVKCDEGYGSEAGTKRSRIYSMGRESVLAICDCQAGENADGTYKAGKLSGGHQGAIIIPQPSENRTDYHSRLYLYDGIITENQLTVNGGAVIVQMGSTFNMYGGQITGNENIGSLDTTTGVYTNDFGSGVYVSTSVFNMYGGEISHNKSTRGSGIWVAHESTVNLYGGSINNNVAYLNPNADTTNNLYTDNKGFGGGIYISGNDATTLNSTLNMYGGEIVGNTAVSKGGGIQALRAKLNLLGGVINGNTVEGILAAAVADGTDASTPSQIDDTTTDDDVTGGDDLGGSGSTADGQYVLGTGYGAGIYMSTSNAYMEGVSINGNSAVHAAVFITNESTVYLKDVTLRENICRHSGSSALYAESGSTLTIENGVITGNRGTDGSGHNAAAVYIPNDRTKLILVGAPQIYGNYRGNGLERNIYLQNSIYENNEDPELASIEHAKLTLGALTDGAKVSVCTQYDYVGDANKDDLAWLIYEPSIVDGWNGHWITYDNVPGSAIMADAEEQKLYLLAHNTASHDNISDWQPFGINDTERVSLPSESGHYYLTADIVMEANHDNEFGRDVGVMLTGDEEIVLCLNGHSIEAFSRLYRLSGNNKLTICDCTGKGTITAGGSYTLNGIDYTTNGGAVCVISNSNEVQLAIKNVTISGEPSKSVSFGGAICFTPASGSLTLDSITFKDLSAGYEDKGGGAIYMSTDGTLSITGCTFENCKTTVASGGAVYANCDTLTVSGSTFKNCSSAKNGGAICAAGQCEATIDSCTFTGCSATENGGAVYASTTASVTVTGDATEQTTFSNCTAAGNGGAIDVDKAAALSMDHASFTSCAATGDGGAVYVYYVAQINTTLADCKFTSCQANDGAAFYSRTSTASSTFTMTNVTVENCTASNIGAFYMHFAKSALFTNCTFTGNQNEQAAASAIYLNRIADTTMDSCTFTNNKNLSTTNTGVGAVYLTNAVKLTLTGNTTFSGNTSDNTNVTSRGIYIQENSATNDATSFQSTVAFKDLLDTSEIYIRMAQGKLFAIDSDVNTYWKVEDADQVAFNVTCENTGTVYTYDTTTLTFVEEAPVTE